MYSMVLSQRSRFLCLILAAVFLVCKTVVAAEFEPGVGVGVEYTDNVNLTTDDKIDDLITVGYVGARFFENEGYAKYDVMTSLNKQSYAKGSFDDSRYFSLAADVNVEMVEGRFNWILTDYFTQRTINTLDPNTPDNLQDTNVFTFGALMRVPLTSRQMFSLTPMYNQYYYSRSLTNNKQVSLLANWNYQAFRTSAVGLNLSTRTIDYDEQAVADTTFTTIGLVLNTRRARTNLTAIMGTTKVSRDTGQETSGFSGSLNLLANLSATSTLNMNVSTALTDTSTIVASGSLDAREIQITTDVVRHRDANVSYFRKNVYFQTLIRAEYSEVEYSESPFDQTARSVDIEMSDYPFTRLLLGGVYARYFHTRRLENNRTDDNYLLGTNLRYRLSRKLNASFDIKYRKLISSSVIENYGEYSFYASLVYGYGVVYRPTRGGGF